MKDFLPTRFFLPAVIFTFLCSTGFADDGSSFAMNSAQLGVIAVNQDSGRSESAILNYNPSYILNSDWSVGAELGLTYLNSDDANKFTAIGYLANVGYHMNEQWAVLLRAGAQTWTCADCGTAFAAGPELAYEFSSPPMKILKNIWFSYLPVFHSVVAHEFSLGFGFKFGGEK